MIDLNLEVFCPNCGKRGDTLKPVESPAKRLLYLHADYRYPSPIHYLSGVPCCAVIDLLMSMSPLPYGIAITERPEL